MKRQKVRKGLLITSLLLFPIIIWYLSPYLIIQGAMEHIINGSFIVFVIMLLSSVFMRRAFCGYLCPAGGIQECAMMVNDRQPKQGWRNYAKYVIWAVWIMVICICYILGKGNVKVDFFYMTDHGISVAQINNYIIYYGVILVFFVPAIIWGKRVACHYYCWMAPFMVIGSKIGEAFHAPQLHIKADKEKCISCQKCNKNCPMCLNVESMVKEGCIRNSECIQCGACVDGCPTKALGYIMKSIDTKN